MCKPGIANYTELSCNNIQGSCMRQTELCNSYTATQSQEKEVYTVYINIYVSLVLEVHIQYTDTFANELGQRFLFLLNDKIRRKLSDFA